MLAYMYNSAYSLLHAVVQTCYICTMNVNKFSISHALYPLKFCLKQVGVHRYILEYSKQEPKKDRKS